MMIERKNHPSILIWIPLYMVSVILGYYYPAWEQLKGFVSAGIVISIVATNPGMRWASALYVVGGVMMGITIGITMARLGW